MLKQARAPRAVRAKRRNVTFNEEAKPKFSKGEDARGVSSRIRTTVKQEAVEDALPEDEQKKSVIKTEIKDEKLAELDVNHEFKPEIKSEIEEPLIPDIEQLGEHTNQQMKPPPNFYLFIDRIREMRAMRPSPVDSVGCAEVGLQEEGRIAQKTVRFQCLISLMLSSQTKDDVTAAAVRRLRTNLKPTLTPESVLAAGTAELEKLLNPVGFFRRKAIYIQQAAQISLDKYDGDVPQTIEEIVAIPGVGPKMGHLLLQNAWDIVDGIGVDVHIHRLAQWWKWVPKTAHPTPEKTREALEQWMPKSMWKDINPLLVGFGQTWCPSRQTVQQCDVCLLNDVCPARKKK